MARVSDRCSRPPTFPPGLGLIGASYVPATCLARRHSCSNRSDFAVGLVTRADQAGGGGISGHTLMIGSMA